MQALCPCAVAFKTCNQLLACACGSRPRIVGVCRWCYGKQLRCRVLGENICGIFLRVAD